MRGTIALNIDDHKVEFDFEEYTYGILFSVDETADDRLRVTEEIEKDSEYQLLRNCLIAKHDFEKIPDSDKEKYRKALYDFSDWCLKKR